jgi:SAM-dependent methyltransferase
MQPKDIYDYHAWFMGKYSRLLKARTGTFYQALMLAVARNVKNIVETGTLRKADNWEGDGQSTLLLAEFASRYGCKLWTCDIDPDAIAVCRELTSPYASQIEYVVSDSVQFLRDFADPIDFLYLDSMDFTHTNPGPPQDHALREGQAALHALHTQSIVLVDDCLLVEGGKGGKVIPYFLGQGWQVIGIKYQVLMTHAFSLMSDDPSKT